MGDGMKGTQHLSSLLCCATPSPCLWQSPSSSLAGKSRKSTAEEHRLEWRCSKWWQSAANCLSRCSLFSFTSLTALLLQDVLSKSPEEPRAHYHPFMNNPNPETHQKYRRWLCIFCSVQKEADEAGGCLAWLLISFYFMSPPCVHTSSNDYNNNKQISLLKTRFRQENCAKTKI